MKKRALISITVASTLALALLAGCENRRYEELPAITANLMTVAPEDTVKPTDAGSDPLPTPENQNQTEKPIAETESNNTNAPATQLISTGQPVSTTSSVVNTGTLMPGSTPNPTGTLTPTGTLNPKETLTPTGSLSPNETLTPTLAPTETPPPPSPTSVPEQSPTPRATTYVSYEDGKGKVIHFPEVPLHK